MAEYKDAGASITEDLSPASLIVGVKSVPINQLLPNKTYAFFSHTIKAQPGSMPLLDAMIEKVTSWSMYLMFLMDLNRKLYIILNCKTRKAHVLRKLHVLQSIIVDIITGLVKKWTAVVQIKDPWTRNVQR